MNQILREAAAQAALRTLQSHPIDRTRRFLRTWLLWDLAIATAGATIVYIDPPESAKDMLPLVASHFIVIAMLVAIPVLIVMIMKWIIFG